MAAGRGQPADPARSQCLWGSGAAEEEGKEEKEPKEEGQGRTLAQLAKTAGARQGTRVLRCPPGSSWVFPVLLLTSGGNPAALREATPRHRRAAVGKGREKP